MNKPQLNLQDTFLNHARKENVGVTIYLVNSIKLQGHVRGFDAFTILLDTPGKPPQLVYKHSVTSIVPMRPLQNLFADAMRDQNMQGQHAERPGDRPVPPAGPGPESGAPPAPPALSAAVSSNGADLPEPVGS